MVLTGIGLARPLTHELTQAILERLGLHARRVKIDRVERGVFYARGLVGLEMREETFDARPSDALNLAIRAGAPVHVADPLLQDAQSDHRPTSETVGTIVELVDEQTGERIALLRAREAPSVGRGIRLMKSTEHMQHVEISPGSSPPVESRVRLTPASEWEVVTIEQLEPSNWHAVARRAA